MVRLRHCELLSAYINTPLIYCSFIGTGVVVAAAVRDGLSTQLPPAMLSLLRWDELETLVCGESTVDLNLLKSATEYGSGYGPDDPIIIWFWSVLSEDFSTDDLKAFLRFIWGRSRLPLTRWVLYMSAKHLLLRRVASYL